MNTSYGVSVHLDGYYLIQTQFQNKFSPSLHNQGPNDQGPSNSYNEHDFFYPYRLPKSVNQGEKLQNNPS